MSLLRNSIITPDGTVLVSKHRHDYQSHTDKNGKTYAIDGGTDYIRWIGDIQKDCTDTSLYDTDTIEVLREELSWGTYGKDGTEPLHFILIKDMTTEHILNILKLLPLTNFKKVLKRELEYRDLV